MNADDTCGAVRERALHIHLEPELHRQVCIAAAEDDVTLQEWVRCALADVVRARQGDAVKGETRRNRP